jgi:hypothetical protein
MNVKGLSLVNLKKISNISQVLFEDSNQEPHMNVLEIDFVMFKISIVKYAYNACPLLHKLFTDRPSSFGLVIVTGKLFDYKCICA